MHVLRTDRGVVGGQEREGEAALSQMRLLVA
jgi:hypothetical protein